MHAFYSNRIEKLYEQLRDSLFQKQNNPFARRLIIVPSPAIKSWLMLQMAKDLGIATGVQILFLEQAIEKLTYRSKLPNQLELALAIEAEMRQAPPQELHAYFKLHNGKWTRKGERRLIGFSQKLAHLFLQYGIYAGSMVQKWAQAKDVHWQGALWKGIFSKMNWKYPYEQLTTPLKLKEDLEDVEIHLFSLSYLPAAHHAFLQKVSAKLPVNYYLLSPCQAFWSDICSDKERRHQQKMWKRLKINDQQQMQLEHYLRERNPLLANFGRLGREMAKYLEESEIETHSAYVIAQEFESIKPYSDLIFEEIGLEDKPKSLLSAIQCDMVLLRTPDPNQKVQIESHDRSIQVHLAGSKQREIQILYNNLMKIIEENPQISPSDIIVMAPEIAEYEPYIKSEFGSEESQLSFHLNDLQITHQSRLTQGFLDLLKLPLTRWDLISVMRLFDNPAFQQAQKLTWEDVRQISGWLSDVKVRWGEDAFHRDELLQRDYCERGMVEKTSAGTWSDGFSRLLLGLIQTGSEDPTQNTLLSTLPYESIDATQAELLGRLISLMRSLRADLKPLADGTKMPPGEWSAYLKCLLKAYFGVDEFQSQPSDDAVNLLVHIDMFTKVDFNLSTHKFAFDTIRVHFEKGLNSQKTELREGNLNSIKFCSMLPMRAIPAKVIALLGMNEGSFPRVENSTSLNLMNGNSDVDFCPTQTDYDRYLFLEALLSARDYFVISYVANASDSQEQAPSLLVSEFLDYIDASYVFNDNSFRALCVIKHPFYEFDRFYFTQQEYPAYLSSQYRLARAHYHHQQESHQFLPNFTSKRSINPESAEFVVDIKELAAFAKNPLKTYFKGLGIYFKDEEELKSEEDFILSPIDLARLSRGALKKPLEDLLAMAHKEGIIPPGVFKSVALEKIRQEAENLKTNLAEVGVNAEHIFDVEFSDQTEVAAQIADGHWKVPPLTFEKDGRKIKIVGKLTDLTPKGLLAHIRDVKAEATKAWPQFLLLNMLLKSYGLPIENQLIFAKSGKAKAAWYDNPEEHLKRYLDYYFESVANASPLIPEWIPDFIEKESGEVRAGLNKKINDDFSHIYNDYLQWICREGEVPDCESLEVEWKPKAHELYGELFANWYSKRGKNEKL